jgi:hypothetical protein
VGKPATVDEIRKQERLCTRLEKKKIELRDDTRENNKALDTAYTKLRCMISGEEPPELFDGNQEKGKGDDE